MNITMKDLTPSEIVKELDKYVIGQTAAKKSVAVALRNRYRRQKANKDIREDILPNNILMIGPTGVGKTEIARRLAKLVKAPFVKVEASKFTEVGYVGRDVESMVRDLMETSISIVKEEKSTEIQELAQTLAESRLVDIMLPPIINKTYTPKTTPNQETPSKSAVPSNEASRKKILDEIRSKKLDDKLIELEVTNNQDSSVQIFGPFGQMEEVGGAFQSLMDSIPKSKKKRKVPISEAKEILKQEEIQKLIDMDAIVKEAKERTENEGIVFIDEIDKIAGKETHSGGDISRESVQQDLLPIVEGSSVNTKHGVIKTDYILFIASGAFHATKPSDLIPELQGRFPIRVELKALSKEDFIKILLHPKNAIVKQYIELLKSDNVALHFTDSSIKAIAENAIELNENVENIGARRLYTIMSALLEDHLFNAPDNIENHSVSISEEFVNQRLNNIVKDKNLNSYIL